MTADNEDPYNLLQLSDYDAENSTFGLERYSTPRAHRPPPPKTSSIDRRRDSISKPEQFRLFLLNKPKHQKYIRTIREIVTQNPECDFTRSMKKEDETRAHYRKILSLFPSFPDCKQAFCDFCERAQTSRRYLKRKEEKEAEFVPQEGEIPPEAVVCKYCKKREQKCGVCFVPLRPALAHSADFKTLVSLNISDCLEKCRRAIEEDRPLSDGEQDISARSLFSPENPIENEENMPPIQNHSPVVDSDSDIPSWLTESAGFKQLLSFLKADPEAAEAKMKTFCDVENYREYHMRKMTKEIQLLMTRKKELGL